MKLSEVGGVGIVTKQNATKDVPVGGEYMNVKKLGLGSGKPKLHDKKATKNTTPNKLFNLGISEDMVEGKRVPRKKGQPAGSKKHSDLYTDENPKGTIHGLKFATVKDAKASVNKIKRSGKKHAHKIQAAIAMEQRAKAAGKVSAAAVYRKYINAMKKKTKKMNELRIERPDPKDTLGVKRKDMPQIKSEDYNLFYAYLKKNGAKFTKDTMPASELRAMQKEFSDEGIMKQMRKNIEQGPNTKAVIVSSDGYIMDGHHRWLVALNTGSDLNVMRVNMPAFELYDLVNKFEKSYYKDMYDSVEMGETRGSIGVPLASGLVVSVFPHRPLRIKKSTPGKLRYDETLDEEIADWFADKWQNIFEKWSAKYKKSINCNNPKGFSQRAHCAGRKKKKKSESINEETGKEMFAYFQKMHHEPDNNTEMKQFILSHDWELRDFTPDMFPSEEEFFDYDDPFDRIIDIDYYYRADLSQPIIVGPQYSDGKYSVIDGNHRAAAAQGMGKTIKGYFPVKQVNEEDSLDGPRSYSALDDLMTEAPTARDSMNLDADKLQQSIDYFYTTHAPKNFGSATTQGNFKGLKVVTFTKGSDTLMFLVNNNDQAVFYVMYSKFDDGVAIGNVRSNGTVKATEVYAYLVDKFGTLYSDDSQTPQGRKIWTSLAKFYPNLDVKDKGGRLVATLKEARGTCWRGYQQKGFKKKGNRMVPNCVKEEETDSLGSQINFPGYEKKDEPKKPKKKQKPKSMYDKIVGTFTSAFNLDEGINDPHIFKAVFMAGGPGSGKGFVAQNLLGGTGLRTVNSDDMYEYLLKKQDLALDPDTIASPQGQEIRQRAKTLIKSRQAQYIDGRIGLVIDGTGKDPNVISKHVNKLREVGYDVAMIFVNTSLEVAQQRNQKRERTLPRDLVTQLWNEVQENIMKFQQIFRPDRFFVIDNSGGLEDLDRKENFDKVYNETQRFLNTPPRKKAALAWIQQQKEQNDAERSAKQQQNKEPDGGTTNSN